MKRILVIWGNWGPYHYARFRAFREAGFRAGYEVEGLELFASSGVYAWEADERAEGVHYVNVGERETAFYPWRMTRIAIPRILSLRPDVVFVPSYWHWSLYINLMARLCGRSRIVMMNESHGGTEKARGWKKEIKRRIVRSFHAALVGGQPHREYFSGLGLEEKRIFTGYDAVDNKYFAEKSAEARRNAGEQRSRLGLPNRYFLSLGRMVEKKNLGCLIEAYALYRERNPDAEHHLVFVGSGEMEDDLRALCLRFGLQVRDPAPPGPIFSRDSTHLAGDAKFATAVAVKSAATLTETTPSVHFFGFRQIQENPIFYALADAFILPSHTEEWGLVVNEAMACGLPVIVSENVGSAADLVAHGENGFLFDPASPSELASHLETLADDPDRREAMGQNSAVRIAGWSCDNFATNGLRAAKAALG